MPNRKDRQPPDRTFSPDDREVLAGGGAELFEYAVRQGEIASDDPRIAADAPDRPAFELLLRLGLLTPSAAHHGHVPVDPSAIAAQVVTPMGQHGAQLLTESSNWAVAFNSLGLTWRRSPGANKGPFTELRGQSIGDFIETIVNDAQHEVLSAQPQTGRNTAALPKVTDLEMRAMERGVSMRTLYQHAARRSTPTHAYVAAVAEKGGQVRTLDEFFNRMIVVDGEVAVIPSVTSPSPSTAIVVRELSIVAYFVDIFERAWERARPFTSRDLSTVTAIAAEQREMTIRMLIEGHADPTAAKRLGVSPRTYAGYVADLKDEYDAQTRFQLGYAMGRRDATNGPPPEDPAPG